MRYEISGVCMGSAANLHNSRIVDISWMTFKRSMISTHRELPGCRTAVGVRVRLVLPPDGATAEPSGYLGVSHRDELPGLQILSVHRSLRRSL